VNNAGWLVQSGGTVGNPMRIELGAQRSPALAQPTKNKGPEDRSSEPSF
jgi:hypothetical protein